MFFCAVLLVGVMCARTDFSSSVAAQGQTFTVTTTADNNDDTNPTLGSLRFAITKALGGSRIVFNIPRTDPGFANGVFTFKPTAPYPVLRPTGLVIDGTTQTAMGGDTNPQGPEIFISGEAGLRSGLALVGTDITVRGIGIINCRGDGASGIILDGDGAKNNRVQGCYLGVGPTGMLSAPNTRGLVINESNDNMIGGPNAADRNVIAGNLETGVVISGVQTQGNVIQNNFIGTGANGEAAPSTGTLQQRLGGVFIEGLQNRLIGNVISGNGDSQGGLGLLITGDANVFQGNRVGTNASGTKALPNGLDGISLGGARNQLGGFNQGEGNQISGNGRNGLRVGTGPGATENVIQGNLIGTDAAGTKGLPNDGFGVVFLEGAHDNTLGGNEPGARNIIAFNNRSGVGVVDTDPENRTSRNRITRNSIFQNMELAIDLGGDGVTPNDLGDKDEGPNDFMNFPIIQSGETVSGNTMKLVGQAGLGATVEIFAVDADMSGNGEGVTYLGSVDTGKETLFSMMVTVPAGTRFLSATATDDKGSTSEFGRNLEISAGPPPPPDDTVKPTVTLTAPNGGDKLKVGKAFTIAWTATDNVAVVSQTIQLSIDAGKTFTTTLAEGLPGTAATFSFTPAAATKAGRIKIIAKDAAGNSGEAASAGNFKIK